MKRLYNELAVEHSSLDGAFDQATDAAHHSAASLPPEAATVDTNAAAIEDTVRHKVDDRGSVNDSESEAACPYCGVKCDTDEACEHLILYVIEDYEGIDSPLGVLSAASEATRHEIAEGLRTLAAAVAIATELAHQDGEKWSTIKRSLSRTVSRIVDLSDPSTDHSRNVLAQSYADFLWSLLAELGREVRHVRTEVRFGYGSFPARLAWCREPTCVASALKAAIERHCRSLAP